MKKILLILTAVIFIVGVNAGFCEKATPTPAKPATPATPATPAKPETKVLKEKGEITAIDEKANTFTIKKEDGSTITLKIAPSKIKKIKVGEKVEVNYYKEKEGELKAISVKKAVEKKKVKKEEKK